MIYNSRMFRVYLSVRKLYVCAYGYVKKTRLTEKYQSVKNIDLVRKHRYKLDVLFFSSMNHIPVPILYTTVK